MICRIFTLLCCVHLGDPSAALCISDPPIALYYFPASWSPGRQTSGAMMLDVKAL